MKRKGLLIGSLLFVALLVTSVTFAFWASGILGENDEATGTITIGEGEEVQTTVSVADESEDNNLVPTAYGDAGVDDTDVLEFTVVWEGTGATGATGTLNVTIDSYSLGSLSENEIDQMFSINVTSGTGAITAGTDQSVEVEVIFHTEPANQSIYDEVANGTLSITLTFDVDAD